MTQFLSSHPAHDHIGGGWKQLRQFALIRQSVDLQR